MEENKPKLENAKFTFSQEPNCIDGGDMEEITIRCESDMGIDNEKGCFYVLETKRWALDSINELKELFDRISKVIQATDKSK
jgi:hypothetical protein